MLFETRTLLVLLATASGLVLHGCRKAPTNQESPASSTDNAPANAAASDDSPTKACGLATAMPDHVAQVLGTERLNPADEMDVFGDKYCRYSPAGVNIRVSKNASPPDFQKVRKGYEGNGTGIKPGPIQDYPNFGDEAFVQVTPWGNNTPHTTLGVRKGNKAVYVDGQIPLAKIRALEVELMHELGAM